MDKDVVHIYSGKLFSHKNEIMPSVATWMDLEIIITLSKSEKETQVSYITYMWNLKYDTDELNQTDLTYAADSET